MVLNGRKKNYENSEKPHHRGLSTIATSKIDNTCTPRRKKCLKVMTFNTISNKMLETIPFVPLTMERPITHTGREKHIFLKNGLECII